MVNEYRHCHTKLKGPTAMKTQIFAALLLAILFPLHAQAQNTIDLPDGHTALNISATENVKVEQDLLVASLRIQEEGEDAKQVQAKINEAMAKATALVKTMPSLKLETGQYYVHPDYRYIRTAEEDNKRVLDKWRGAQTLTIKSEVSEDVLNVTGQIQDMGFMMNSLDYQLSPKKYEDTRDSLMETTVADLQARAERVAKALGKSQVDIVEINVDANPFQPGPIYTRGAKMEMMAMSADAAMPSPTAEAGETTVSMTINARAIIKP
jgi:predicted secreted protein